MTEQIRPLPLVTTAGGGDFVRLGIVAAGMAAVFIGDLFAPLGIVAWVFHLFLLWWASTFHAGLRNLPWLAAAATCFVILGYFLSPPGVERWIAVLNRSMGVTVVWLLTVVLLRLAAQQEGLARSEAALYESRERLAVTLTSIGDAVIATDCDARVTFANRVALDLLGRASDDVAGRSLKDIFHIVNEETRAPVDNPVDRVLIEGRVVGLANHTVLIRPDRREIPIDDSAAPIRDATGRLLGVVLVFRDITERKEAEDQRARWTAELSRQVADRTKALVQSQQQLRNLAMQLTIAEQQERRRLATELHDYLAQMLVAARIKLSEQQALIEQQPAPLPALCRELDDILKQSIAYTRTLMAQLTPPELHDVGLAAALRRLRQHLSNQGLAVEVRAEQEPTGLSTEHAVLLFQSVRELLINVRKHAQVPRASVALRVEEDKTVMITVEDEGPGFDPTARRPAGSGEHFGLYSVQERMAALGGWCRVDSAPGRGTTVTLGLPLGSQREPGSGSDVRGSKLCGHGSEVLSPNLEHRTQNLERHQQDAKPLRVLLVDDHAMVRQGLKSMLETYPDIAVIGEASDGEEAVAAVGRLQPDLVLIDVHLPRLNGIDATRRIRQAWPDIAVIGLSVQCSGQVVEAMVQAGARTCLEKETAAEHLYEAILQLAR